MVRVGTWTLVWAAWLSCALACSSDELDRTCAGNEDCVLLNTCCLCQAVRVGADTHLCNVTGCDTPRCFQEHGDVELTSVCISGQCELQLDD